jgi:hypothetical protein
VCDQVSHPYKITGKTWFGYIRGTFNFNVCWPTTFYSRPVCACFNSAVTERFA